VTVLVLGVGSPFGDDRVGWEVVTALDAALQTQAARATGVLTLACDRPGAALVNAFHGVEHLIIVDAACIPGAVTGRVQWLAESSLDGSGSASTHGFGVGQALALARMLRWAPARIDVLGVCGGQFEGDTLSPPVSAAVPGAVREIIALLTGLHADRGHHQQAPAGAR
jgi:hydrogenase maturation protease